MKVSEGMTKTMLEEQVRNIISRVTRINPNEILGNKLIRDDLGVDSMQAIEALAVLEKELKIVIDPEKAFTVATVDDLFMLIHESVNSAKGERSP